MTKYTSAVENGLRGLEAVSTGLCPGCEQCRESFEYVPDDGDGYWKVAAEPDAGVWLNEASCQKASERLFEAAWSDGRVESEPGFSGSPCGICGTALGGNREVWHWIDPESGTIQHEYDACVDCVVYLANGDEPEVWEAA